MKVIIKKVDIVHQKSCFQQTVAIFVQIGTKLRKGYIKTYPKFPFVLHENIHSIDSANLSALRGAPDWLKQQLKCSRVNVGEQCLIAWGLFKYRITPFLAIFDPPPHPYIGILFKITYFFVTFFLSSIFLHSLHHNHGDKNNTTKKVSKK